MAGDQLGLLLWKNYVIRKRQPGILSLVFLWPLFVFLILYTVRDNIEPEYFPTCQFPARFMPQDGILPFVQSFVCGVANPCEPLSEYEEVPTYKNAMLSPLMRELQTVLRNDTILSAVHYLPKGIQLLKSMAQILTQPEIKQIFDRGILLGDLFNNHEVIKRSLKTQVPQATDHLLDGLFNSSIKLIYLIEGFGSSNIEDIVCSAENLKKYLVVPNEKDLVTLSKVLCELDSTKIPGTLEQLTNNLDFTGLLEVVSRVMAKFQDYDFLEDIRKTAELILNLQIVEKYVPKYLKLRDWIPKIIPLFKNVTFKEIDLVFINKAMAVLDPIFADEQSWSIARDAFLKLNDLLALVKDMINHKKIDGEDVSNLIQNMGKNTMDVDFENIQYEKNLTKVLDKVYLILQDGIKLTSKLIRQHEDKIQIAAEVLDGLKNYFSTNILNMISYLVSLTDNVVQMTHHIAILHNKLLLRIISVANNHKAIVEKILTTVEPNDYKTIVDSLSRLDVVEKILSDFEFKPIEEAFCEDDNFNEIFSEIKEKKDQLSNSKDLLCSESGKKLISDVYNIFELGNFSRIVDNTLGTFISVALKRPMKLEKSNLTAMISNIRSFINYLETPESKISEAPIWSSISISDEWMKTFKESQAQGRLDLLAIHLTIAKILGSKSFSYFTIEPNLIKMDQIAGHILQDIQTQPTEWILEVRTHMFELIESFYLTVMDKPKVLKLLEYSNLTTALCVESESQNLINFPQHSNATLLKILICRQMTIVESSLNFNLSNAKSGGIMLFQKSNFNWTAFNEKLVKIYYFVDSLVHQEDPQYTLFDLDTMMLKFKQSWTENLTIKDAWEVSVGVLCKLLSVIEYPLFNAKEISNYQDVHAIAWASYLLVDNIEGAIDHIQKKNHTIDLEGLITEMPLTEGLISKLLRNLVPVTLDLADMTLKIPLHFISAIDDYTSREPDWPCIKNQSVGEALELRKGSRQLVKEIEKISCDSRFLIKEWKEQPLLVKVRKTLQHNESVELPPFNWTHGYSKFRRLVGKMNSLLDSPENGPSLSVYVNNFIPEVKKMITESLPGAKSQTRKILDFIDLRINEGVGILNSNLSAMDLWKRIGTTKDLNYFLEFEESFNRFLGLGKYFTNVLHDVILLFTDIFSESSKDMSMLSLLGFRNKSAIAITYHHLPYILATFINGISDPTVDSQAILAIKNKNVSCSEIFSWFYNSKVDLTDDEFRILKNFTCDLDPDNFNAFTDLYMKEAIIWERSFSEYQSYFLSFVIDLYDLSKTIENRTNSGMKISLPFGGNYFHEMLRTLKRELNNNVDEIGGIILRNNPEGKIYRLVIEGFSEVLNKMAKTLSELDLQSNELHTWDLFKKGDVHQLMILLEHYPRETISLIFLLTEIDPETMQPFTIKHFRKNWCTSHPKLGFWGQPNATHFLREICSFDFDELLRTLSSDELLAAAAGQTDVLRRVTPLSKSISLFLDQIIQLRSKNPEVTFKSNIFNSATWKAFSIETWKIINQTELSWINLFVTEYFPDDSRLGQAHRLPQVLTSVIEILSGGDVWQKLRNIYEGSKVKPLLTILEDLPNLAVTIVDTFVNSERLNDFVERLLAGRVDLCDIDKFLIPPNFVRNKGILSSITIVCQKIIKGGEKLKAEDFLPLDFYAEKNRLFEIRYNSGSENSSAYNKTYLMEKVYKLQTTLIRIVSDGLKDLKVPTWWNSFEEGTFKDFLVEYKSKDLRKLAHSIVKKFVALLKNILISRFPNDNCSWCNTLIVEILNSQLIRHAEYSKLICRMEKMNIQKIQETLTQEFYWNKTASMIKDYNYLNNKKTINSFMAATENSLHYIADIVVDFQNATYKKEVKQCFHKLVGGPSYSRPGLYITMMIGLLDVVEKNIRILDLVFSHEKTKELTQTAEKYVPIWKPLSEVVDTSSVKIVNDLLPDAKINVNLLSGEQENSLCYPPKQCQNASILYEILSSKQSRKLLLFDHKISNYDSMDDVSEALAKNLDFKLIDYKIIFWRKEAAFNLTWLKNILRHISAVLEEGGNIFDVAYKIDFENVSNALGVPDLVDGVVNIINEKTIDKLFDGMNEILDDVDPFIEDPMIKKDLRTIVHSLESMEIFKNLGLLNMKYGVRDMFKNWDLLRKYLIEKTGIPKEAANIMSEAKVDMVSIFLKEQRAMNLKDTICSPTKLSDMLSFDQTHITAEEVSSILCDLDGERTQNMTITLIMNLNFEYIFKNLMSANVKHILSNANLTEADGKGVFEHIGVAAELMPFFKEKLASSFTSAKLTDDNNSSDSLSSGQFLRDASKMLCGKPLFAEGGQFYRVISSIKDQQKKYDERQLNSLPTEFCRDTYKSVLEMPGGKIIWSYIKPLLRGRILYSPNTTPIQEVIKIANQSFYELNQFIGLMSSFQKTLVSIGSLTEMGDSLNELKDIMSSDVMKVAIKSMSGANVNVDFSNLDLSEVAWQLKKSKSLVNMIEMLNELMNCVLLDRFIGFSTEDEVEKMAGKLMETNDFMAGVIFLENSRQHKRSLEYNLPHNVTYKIRMDVDYVPSTTRLKNQFWLPGPESDFLEHMRYVRGFIQIQDSIDRAIIKLKSGTNQEWITLIQQMPYPCWKNAPFQSGLYESQGLQVGFFFALMMCVGAAVRHIVWERESQNAMVMSVMGLKPWRNTLAWSITCFIELTIIMVSIAVILLVGKILPKADPLLILILFFDYIFSIVAFCYMISTMFTSASLAAVTTVVMFLLTYMPYIIVIAMEANMSLGYKMIICFSMSTSFSYGCLYAVRREVQGIGLAWNTLWEESSPGDPMSLGLVLIMIFIDGCIYTLIGYLVTRYTNSGKGLHGLRSRSLWWANNRALYGRPSYLASINNLYFTNDVLHHSITYQDDDSDTSSLIVNQMQVGVSFDGVRKIYQTEQGVRVAIDDFTLKLCEGEVTSLLGRNGAGKTTIIKMLTGMIAPTCGEIQINGDDIKPDIGVCPQENVLIPVLTPREHMTFYAKLKKSIDRLEMIQHIDAMLASLELGHQENEPVSRLSGGTRRRLCVALAFLGSPKLVILDEPGAGVDPAARHRIWRLIDQHRVGRTVLLSTHHLDEADMLSDTVVVMHKGKILRAGSPLTLKTTLSQGYKMHVSFPVKDGTNAIQEKSLENISSLVKSVVFNAYVREESSSEVVVILPYFSINGTNNDIAAAAKVLEDNKEIIGFTHFSLECDTLERVFLNLCAEAENGLSLIRASQDSVATAQSVVSDLNHISDDIDLIDYEPEPRPSPFKQAKALLKKRIWHFARDWKAPLSALILPTMFVAVAMGFSLIRPPSEDEPPLILNPRLYNTHPTYFYSVDNDYDMFLQHVSVQLHNRFGDDHAGAWQPHPNDTGACECLEGQQVCHGVSQAVEGLFQTVPGRPTLDWIVSTHQEYIEKRYGGWSLSHFKNDPLFVVWFNNKGHHALPAYLNALNEAIMQASGVDGHLITINHPLKLSSDQLNRISLLQHVADVGVALVLLVAFSLVGAQGARELVRERLSEEKRILYLAGVHPVTYWTTALIWDFLVFECAIGLAVIVFEIFGLPTYVARDNLAGICILLCLFAWAVIPFTHLVEKLFDDSSLSNMVLFCVNTFVGVSSLATILVIDILGKSQTAADIRYFLHYLMLLLLPQYALGDALVELSKNEITAELLGRFNMDTYKSPLGWDLIGLHYVCLFVVGTILYFANLAIECRVLPDITWKRHKVHHGDVKEDPDVARERVRVEKEVDQDVLKTVKLRKEYRSVYGTNIAVQNLSFGIQSGTCFGLLGVNGAGKSTTFKMLTTEIRPTSGSIYLNGSKIGAGPLCNGKVGYCPQSDALDGFLTPHQCLTIHGEVCGLVDVPKAVGRMLKRLDLIKYAYQRVDSLSGGNKRKLCAAISLMSPVSVVLMDEPTSGMDPAAKELFSQAVRQMMRNQAAVIMTSHSVVECEKLCLRVGILAKAGLRCIGSPQHLINRFGEGYIVFLRFNQSLAPDDLKGAISRHIPKAIICSRQAKAARLLIPRAQEIALSMTFTKVRNLAEDLQVTDFSVTQSSLDQILVNFSEKLEESSDSAMCFTNLSIRSDSIHLDTF